MHRQKFIAGVTLILLLNEQETFVGSISILLKPAIILLLTFRPWKSLLPLVFIVLPPALHDRPSYRPIPLPVPVHWSSCLTLLVLLVLSIALPAILYHSSCHCSQRRPSPSPSHANYYRTNLQQEQVQVPPPSQTPPDHISPVP